MKSSLLSSLVSQKQNSQEHAPPSLLERLKMSKETSLVPVLTARQSQKANPIKKKTIKKQKKEDNNQNQKTLQQIMSGIKSHKAQEQKISSMSENQRKLAQTINSLVKKHTSKPVQSPLKKSKSVSLNDTPKKPSVYEPKYVPKEVLKQEKFVDSKIRNYQFELEQRERYFAQKAIQKSLQSSYNPLQIPDTVISSEGDDDDDDGEDLMNREKSNDEDLMNGEKSNDDWINGDDSKKSDK